MERMNPFIDASREAQFILHVVREAANLARIIQDEMNHSKVTKGDRSPVTVADFAVQAVVGERLAHHFEGELMVAEESSQLLSSESGPQLLAEVTSFVRRVIPAATPEQVCCWIDRGMQAPGRRCWILDPVDGTKGFLRGGQYAVALALLQDGVVEAAALGCPRLDPESSLRAESPASGRDDVFAPSDEGTVVAAVRGKGSWVTSLDRETGWTRLKVSGRSDPTEARVIRSVESGHTNVEQMEILLKALGTGCPPVQLDSQVKYALVAAGQGDFMVRLISSRTPDYRECVWDHAAGALITEEAGGRVTDLYGSNLDFRAGRRLLHNRGILATNGKLHEPILRALRKIPEYALS